MFTNAQNAVRNTMCANSAIKTNLLLTDIELDVIANALDLYMTDPDTDLRHMDVCKSIRLRMFKDFINRKDDYYNDEL